MPITDNLFHASGLASGIYPTEGIGALGELELRNGSVKRWEIWAGFYCAAYR